MFTTNDNIRLFTKKYQQFFYFLFFLLSISIRFNIDVKFLAFYIIKYNISTEKYNEATFKHKYVILYEIHII